MGFDLTNERIQDTYEQLLQISGSTILDGTGSIAPVSLASASYADFAVTASYAENAGDFDTSSLVTLTTFNAYTSSNDSALADKLDTTTFTSFSSSVGTEITDINAQIAALEAGSGSADWLLLTNKPEGIVSGAAQTIQNLSGSVYVRDDENVVLSNPNGNQTFSIENPLGGDAITFRGAPDFITTFENAELDMAQSDIVAIGSLSGSWGRLAINGTNRLRLTSRRGDGLIELANDNGTMVEYSTTGLGAGSSRFFVPVTASYGLQASDALISGDLTVNGTASFGYLQSITGSAKIIGDAFIQVNTDTPALRYAGLQVVDSGSTADTASFIWDSENNDFFYEYDGQDPTDYGVFLIGPEYATKGSPTYNASNKLVKGTGGHHLVDSSITDTGTSVSMSVPLTASAFSGDGSGLTGVGGVTQEGSGTDSIESTVGQAASANGTNSIAIGNAAQVTGVGANGESAISIGDTVSNNGVDSVHIGSAVSPRSGQTTSETVAIGYNISGVGYSVQVGSNITNNGTGGVVAVGRSITVNSDYGVAIGENAVVGNGVAIGQNANISSYNGVAVGNGASNGNNYATAIGESANASNDASIAIGAQVAVVSNQGIAIGTEADVLGSSVGAIALGQGVQVTGTQAIGIGQGVSTSAANEINIGDIFKYDGTSAISLIGQVSSSLGFVGDGSGLTNVSATSASYAATASMASGNFKVDGQVFSPTFAGSVASATSSIDFDNGNFATLNLTSATFLANPSNLKSGTTYTIILDSGSLISNHGTAWKFADGTAPTYSNGTDVLTAVSDGTNLYATALTNFS